MHISLFVLLILNWNDKYVHTLRSSLENHIRFKTKIGEVYTGFRPKRRKNPTQWGDGAAHTYIAYIRESPPLPPPRAGYCCYLWHWWKIAFWLLRCRWKNVTQSFEEFWLDSPLSHGGYIWSDMSGETLLSQVTCVSYHVNNNYQLWITGKVFGCQVDIFLMFSTSNRNQSSKKSLLGVNVIIAGLKWPKKKEFIRLFLPLL